MTAASDGLAAQRPAAARDREAWSEFWADSSQSRCASGAPEIWQSLAAHWHEFARSLPRGAHVLDLGCGAGAVGRLLLGARDDLHVTGIDVARVPHSTIPRMRLLSDIHMESMPFADGAFSAVVSQFGFEYSQTGHAAREVARVLEPAGSLSLLVHHSHSAIVRANRERRAAVVAFLAPPMRTAFSEGDAAGLGTQIARLVERHPDDPLLGQLARALPTRLGWLRDKRVSTWESLEEALAPEMCIAESLDAACVAPSELEAWLAPLRAEFDPLPVSILREADDTPIAWRAGALRRPRGRTERPQAEVSS
jgi:SAM-dependent methyltransferase